MRIVRSITVPHFRRGAIRSDSPKHPHPALAKLIQTTMNPWLLSIPLAYLLGSIPFGYLLVKIFRKQDIRATGSGNIGATNVARSGAKGLGIAKILLDCGTAFLSVKIAQHLAPADYDLAVVAAVAAILGHVFPIWLGFRGGKGVASALGVFLALSPAAAGCTFAIFLVIFLITRYVSLASIIGSALFPIFGLYFVPVHTPVVIAGFLFIQIGRAS